MISKEKWEEMKTNENLKFWIKFKLVNRIIEFEMIWKSNEVIWKRISKWFTNDKENICERKRDFWGWNTSKAKFKIILGSNIEYGNGNDLKDLKWEFKTLLKR